jgi:hypothetical protein
MATWRISRAAGAKGAQIGDLRETYGRCPHKALRSLTARFEHGWSAGVTTFCKDRSRIDRAARRLAGKRNPAVPDELRVCEAQVAIADVFAKAHRPHRDAYVAENCTRAAGLVAGRGDAATAIEPVDEMPDRCDAAAFADYSNGYAQGWSKGKRQICSDKSTAYASGVDDGRAGNASTYVAPTLCPPPYDNRLASGYREGYREGTRQREVAAIEAQRQHEAAEAEANRQREAAEAEASRERQLADAEAARQREADERREREIAEANERRARDEAAADERRARDEAAVGERRERATREADADQERESTLRAAIGPNDASGDGGEVAESPAEPKPSAWPFRRALRSTRYSACFELAQIGYLEHQFGSVADTQQVADAFAMFCGSVVMPEGATLRYANGQVATYNASTPGAQWYYPNGRTITSGATGPGASWYYPGGQVMTHAGHSAGSSYYYPTGQVISHSVGTSGASWYYINGQVMSHALGSEGATLYYPGGERWTSAGPAIATTGLLRVACVTAETHGSKRFPGGTCK